MATPELSHRNHLGWSSASGWLVGEKGKLQDTACSQAVFCLVMAHTHTPDCSGNDDLIGNPSAMVYFCPDVVTIGSLFSGF